VSLESSQIPAKIERDLELLTFELKTNVVFRKALSCDGLVTPAGGVDPAGSGGSKPVRSRCYTMHVLHQDLPALAKAAVVVAVIHRNVSSSAAKLLLLLYKDLKKILVGVKPVGRVPACL
jgi:hypothetical protein